MRTRQEVDRVMALRAEGLNACEIGRRTGIPRGTVRDWLAGRIPDFGSPDNPRGSCPVCRADAPRLPQAAYTYLLGLYLGDGCLSAHPRGAYKLRISCANAYPELMRRCEQAITEVLPNKVGRVRAVGCAELYAFSKHWICLFPPARARAQARAEDRAHGVAAGADRPRPEPAARGAAPLRRRPCRRRVNGAPYPRYHFSNRSADIQAIFGQSCDALGSSGGRTIG